VTPPTTGLSGPATVVPGSVRPETAGTPLPVARPDSPGPLPGAPDETPGRLARPAVPIGCDV
jgi:hypothetical protein